MKKLLVLFAILPFMISCNGQEKRTSKKIINLLDLKDKIWHTGVSRYEGSAVQEYYLNGFSDDIDIHFLDNDSIELIYTKYSPSIGARTLTLKGLYRIKTESEIDFDLIEPQDAFGKSIVSIGEKEVQYSLYAMRNVKSIDIPKFDITDLPQIKTYQFKIIEHLSRNDFMTELTLIDNNGAKHNFGKYKFDTKHTQK